MAIHKSLVLAPAIFSLAVLSASAADKFSYLDRVKPIQTSGISSLLEARHGKITVLHVWAACCDDCRGTYPGLGSVEKAFSSRGVSVVSLLIDMPAKRAAANRWLRIHPPAVPLWRKDMSDPDAFAQALNSDWRGKLPFTLIYSADGTAAELFEGPHSVSTIKARIERILQTKKQQDDLNNQ
jgi:AhpC/TSA family